MASLLQRLARPVTVRTISRTGADAHGVRRSEITAEKATTAVIQPAGPSAEELRGRDTVTGDWLAVFPDPAVAIGAGDQVVDENDLVYEVTGFPAPLNGPSGVRHIEARLRRVTDL